MLNFDNGFEKAQQAYDRQEPDYCNEDTVFANYGWYTETAKNDAGQIACDNNTANIIGAILALANEVRELNNTIKKKVR